jgi:hypothetical protein
MPRSLKEPLGWVFSSFNHTGRPMMALRARDAIKGV